MAETGIYSDPLPVGSIGRRASGWYGMLAVIMTEGALFAFVLFSYYYFAVQYGREWLPPEPPGFAFSIPNACIVIIGSIVLWFGERAIRGGDARTLVIALAVASALGTVFTALQLIEWFGEPFTVSSTSYGSNYFLVTGVHLAHMVSAVLILVFLLIWALFDYFDARRYTAVSIGVVYWYFVAVVYLAVFFTIYITPRLE